MRKLQLKSFQRILSRKSWHSRIKCQHHNKCSGDLPWLSFWIQCFFNNVDLYYEACILMYINISKSLQSLSWIPKVVAADLD